MLFESLSKKMANVFKKLRSKGKLTEKDIKNFVREIKLALLEADVNYKIVTEFIDCLAKRAVGSEILESLTPEQQIVKIVKDELTKLMGKEDIANEIVFPSKLPCVVMMCGLQGSGKTTQSAKIARYYSKKGHRPLLVACDIYRPAAIEQLKVVGEKINVHVFEMGQISPIEIANKALSYAKDYGHDLMILDTAGRLHVDEKLMEELTNLKQSLTVHETLFVIDAMMGQDAVNVAKIFNDKVGFEGVILTKLDGDTRGGSALSVLHTTGKPIKFIGNGEKLDDLELFQPDRMASRILGMGDILTLVEKAENNIKIKDAEQIAEKIEKNKFDMDDLLKQMKQIKKMGSIRNIIGMIPGMAGKLKDEELEQGEDKIVKVEAIINSMTKKERQSPSILDFNRKKRISKGSGTSLTDINQLLKQFEQMQKLFKKLGKEKSRFKRLPFMKF